MFNKSCRWLDSNPGTDRAVNCTTTTAHFQPFWAAAIVAQLKEWSLPTLEDQLSNPIVTNFYWTFIYFKLYRVKKKERNGPFGAVAQLAVRFKSSHRKILFTINCIKSVMKRQKLRKEVWKGPIKKWKPWSSGYGRRLMFRMSWVQILSPYTGWTFFTYIGCKNCNDVCLKRPKINDKRGLGWPIFLKWPFNVKNCIVLLKFCSTVIRLSSDNFTS